MRTIGKGFLLMVGALLAICAVGGIAVALLAGGGGAAPEAQQTGPFAVGERVEQDGLAVTVLSVQRKTSRTSSTLSLKSRSRIPAATRPGTT